MVNSSLKHFVFVLALSLILVGCVSGTANHNGEIIGGILQGIGQGLSGL